MRKIKFRQPIFHTQKEGFSHWHYWGFIDGGFFGPDGSWPTGKQSQQFTDLKDNKENEIYEGDILLAERKYLSYPRQESIAEVIWYGNGFKTRFIGGIQAIGFFDNYQIIGNIYENPELLEASNA